MSKKQNNKKVKKNTQNPNSNLEFPTDWDIDVYRREYESEEHWQLRRRFMEMHKDKFAEDRLVCLAQVFTNMEFMGCKYPSETMRMVGELSVDVAKEFREQRSNRLKRTFVTASDAAEARAKGKRSTQQQSQGQGQQQWSSTGPNTSAQSRANANKRKYTDGVINQNEFCQPPASKKNTSDLFAGLKYGKFVLFLHGGRNCLCLSATKSHVNFSEKETVADNGNKEIKILIGDKVVATACEDTIKASKILAFTKAMQHLKEHCYTIKPNPLRDTIKIGKTEDNKVTCDVIKTEDGDYKPKSDEDNKLDATNKGYKMMKMMGWSGGGLGSQQQGREDPVSYLLKINRSGLGNSQSKLDRSYFTELLKNYVGSDDIRELRFEPTFTKEERATLHELALRFHLKSHSTGGQDTRRLVITKKTITNPQILEEILLNKNPRFINHFSVQVPKSKSSLYPEHTTELSLDVI